jgi:peptide deformylase
MLKILTYPDQRLHQVSKPVTEFGENLGKLLDAMAETMYSANGVGLAAPQVGEFIRAFVVDIGEAEEGTKHLYEIVNPRLTEGRGKIVYEEGCLSVPGFTAEVSRKEHIRIEFQDRFGKPQMFEVDGLLAVALQHENDHLDGVLFVDKLSPLKRKLAKRKLAKSVTL